MKYFYAFVWALGFAFGASVVTLDAQTVLSYPIDANNAACGDATGYTLAQASTLKLRVAYDAAAVPVFVDTAHTCVAGATAPVCTVAVKWPLVSQTVGRHRVVVQGAAVDPVTGTLSDYATLLDYTVDLTAAKPPAPSPWSNGRIVRVLVTIALAIGAALLAIFGH